MAERISEMRIRQGRYPDPEKNKEQPEVAAALQVRDLFFDQKLSVAWLSKQLRIPEEVVRETISYRTIGDVSVLEKEVKEETKHA